MPQGLLKANKFHKYFQLRQKKKRNRKERIINKQDNNWNYRNSNLSCRLHIPLAESKLNNPRSISALCGSLHAVSFTVILSNTF